MAMDNHNWIWLKVQVGPFLMRTNI